MKILILIVFLAFQISISHGQTCKEIMDFVKSKSYGRTYTSYNSEAISKVTFYQVSVDYNILYFAIVCFKQRQYYGCSEYIYQVASNTENNYARSYLISAGRAFWDFIQPYNEVLGCARDSDDDFDAYEFLFGDD